MGVRPEGLRQILNSCSTSHDQAGRHSRHAIHGRHSGQGRRSLGPVPGWTVIQVYGLIKPGDVATFKPYTENVNPAANLVIVSSRGGNLSAGIGMGIRVHLKKLIVGVMGMCASSCALIWMGGETGRKFFYQDDQVVDTSLLPPSLVYQRGPI